MKENSASKRLIGFIVIVVLLIGLIAAFIVIRNHPGTDPTTYMIKTKNHFDYQKGFECSAYASAYVIRSLGDDANGTDIYEKLEKYPDGTVDPEALMSYLNSSGYDANQIIGGLDDLKNELHKGVPVIAMVRITPGASAYHYLPVVGYDDKYYYAADSDKNYITGEENYYNRKISIDDMKQMLSTEFCEEYLFYTIAKKK